MLRDVEALQGQAILFIDEMHILVGAGKHGLQYLCAVYVWFDYGHYRCFKRLSSLNVSIVCWVPTGSIDVQSKMHPSRLT